MAAQGFSTYIVESGTFRSRHASQQSVEKTALALIYNTEYLLIICHLNEYKASHHIFYFQIEGKY